MRQNFIAQFVQLLKHWFCNAWSGIVMEKNWVFSVDQCQLLEMQFSVHLIDLLSILLRCNGFTGIQKPIVDQTSSSPAESDHDIFGGLNLALESVLELLSVTTKLVIACCHIKSTFCHTSQSN